MGPIFLTGFNGLLGRSILHKASLEGIQIFPLRSEILAGMIYPELSSIKEGTIIHCGADSNKGSAHRDIYKKNVTATEQIVKHISVQDSVKLIFISANSLGLNPRLKPTVTSIYCHSKSLAEHVIKDELSVRSYTILRLPGLYSPGLKGNGILDKLYYGDVIVFPKDKFNWFGNIALVDDVAQFLLFLATRSTQIGHIGGIGTVDCLRLGELADVLKRRDCAQLEQLESSRRSIKLDKIISQKYPNRTMLELIRILYFDAATF